MGLATFIRENQERIVQEWEDFARTLLPATEGYSSAALRDHSAEILDAIIHDMEMAQSPAERKLKAMGEGTAQRMSAVGKIHADLRIEGGMKIAQLIAEYRALRGSVLRMCETSGIAVGIGEYNRFNEAIDEAIIEAAIRYVEMMERARKQFLGILGHDLRTPLGVIFMAASSLAMPGRSGDRDVRSAERILSSSLRMQRMIEDLLDFTRTTLGNGIPVRARPMDLVDLCEQVVMEFHALHPTRRSIRLDAEGPLEGTWDRDRLSQVLSNLIGNAVQHGSPDSPVTVSVREQGEDVVLEVHNEGRAIPEDMLEKIFEPMVRHSGENAHGGSASVGLGLFIAREIVSAHGGTLSVTSDGHSGTTFKLELPRHAASSEPSEPEKGGESPSTNVR
jgi:signal transduction histidine kinase